MKNPLALLAVLAVCLGAAFWLAFSGDDVAVVDPVGPDTVIDAPKEGEELQAKEASANRERTGEPSRAKIQQENTEDVVDPSYAAAMSGFRGRLVAEGGEPVEGKLVEFYRADPELLQNASLFAEQAVIKPELIKYSGHSGANGDFLVEGAWPKTFYLMVIDARGEFQKAQLVEQTPGPGEIIDLGDITLPRLGMISGRVENMDGEPAVGALVRAADVPGTALDLAPLQRFDPKGGVFVSEGGVKLLVEMPPWVQTVFDQIPLPTTQTDDEGAFTLRGVQPGSNVVVVNHSSHVPLVRKGVRVKPGKEKKVGKLALREGEIAEGQVLDSNDEPVVGAQVFLAPKSATIPAHFGSYAKATDAGGKFSESGFPPGPVFAAVRRSPDEAWTIQGPVSVGGDILVKLPAQVAVKIRVRTESGAEPEDVEFRMVALPANGPGIDFGSLGFTPFIDVKKRQSRLPDGAYEIADLLPGQYSLVVRARDCAPRKISFAASAGYEEEVVLAPSYGFQVQVKDRTGKPVRNTKIYVMSRSRGARAQELPVVAGITDTQGVLDVGDGSKGKTRVTASHPAYGLYHAEVELPATAPLVFTFEPSGVLVGELLTNGQPAELGKFTINVEPTWQSNRGAMPIVPRMAVPDAEGRFRVAGLRPGTYRVSHFKSLKAINSAAGIFQMAMVGSEWRSDLPEAEITSGNDTHLVIDTDKKKEIEGPSIAVTGTVLINGRAPVGARLVGWSRSGRIDVEVSETGRFDLGRMSVGYLQLQLESKREGMTKSTLWSYHYRTKENQDLHLDISVETGSISGLVVDASGTAVVGANVRAESLASPTKDDKKIGGQPQPRYLSSVTDGRGRFQIENAPVGTYTVKVTGDQGVGHSEKFQVTAGLASAEARITIAPVYTIKGKVDLSIFKKKPRNLYVWVRTEGFSKGFNVQVTDGSFEWQGLPRGKYTGTGNSWGGEKSQSWVLADGFEVTGNAGNLLLRLKPQTSGVSK